MFEHVTILLSIIFALAMAHILSSATELVWERRQVRFSGLHALWMVTAMLGLLAYWLAIWDLNNVRRWTGLELVLQFLPAIVQYFACSLLSIRREGDGVIDMNAFYERQRPAIFAAFSLMTVLSMFQIYADRGISAGGAGWGGEEIPIALMLAAMLIAGWARPRWLQWGAGLFVLALEALFVATYVG
jgi:hypothetical protein